MRDVLQRLYEQLETTRGEEQDALCNDEYAAVRNFRSGVVAGLGDAMRLVKKEIEEDAT